MISFGGNLLEEFFVREWKMMMTYLVRGSVGVRFKCSYIVARS